MVRRGRAARKWRWRAFGGERFREKLSPSNGGKDGVDGASRKTATTGHGEIRTRHAFRLAAGGWHVAYHVRSGMSTLLLLLLRWRQGLGAERNED